MMMNRKEALEKLKENLHNENLQKHCLANEIVMRFLARKFNEDEEKWALAGLLHDIDYEETKDNPHKHSLVAAEILSQMDLPEDVVYAVKVHNEVHGLPRKSKLDKALYATDPLTGLIVAGALIKPEKKVSALDVDFLVNRFKEKSFARGVNRDQMATCSELGLSLEEFMHIGLEAMQSIDEELGL